MRTADTGFFGWVTELVHRERRKLWAIARREGLSPDDAFDCVHDTLLNFMSLPNARRLAAAPTDVTRIVSVMVKNAARNRRRLHANAAPHDDIATIADVIAVDWPDIDAVIAQAEERLILLGCVTQLARMQRCVVTMRLLEDRPTEQVSKVLGLTKNHVNVLMHRAKSELENCVTEVTAATGGDASGPKLRARTHRHRAVHGVRANERR
jgi:RNA polymerase sigma-70 factor (ECF subfamily)